jgi:hypothetical protein
VSSPTPRQPRQVGCEVCGTVFEVNCKPSHTPKTCSKACRFELIARSRRRRVSKMCPTCGKAFEVIASRSRRSRYCSWVCRRAAAPRVVMVCPICGSSFTVKRSHANKRVTCSYDCAARLNEQRLRGEEGVCEVCGKVFYALPHEVGKRRFCSLACSTENQRAPVVGRREWDRSHRRKTWRKEVLRRDDYRCQKCGSRERLEAHHIMPIGVRPDMAGEVANGIALCKVCHDETRAMEKRAYT